MSPVAGIEVIKDMLNVELGRTIGDVSSKGDLTVWVPLADEIHYMSLPVGKPWRVTLFGTLEVGGRLGTLGAGALAGRGITRPHLASLALALLLRGTLARASLWVGWELLGDGRLLAI
jgi:hypothetical protein